MNDPGKLIRLHGPEKIIQKAKFTVYCERQTPMKFIPLSFTLVLLTVCPRLMAQEQADSVAYQRDSVTVDEKSRSLLPLGIYAEGMADATPGPSEMLLCSQAGIGIQYKSLSGGVFISSYEGGYEQILVFPNTFELEYRFGGGYLGMRVFRYQGFEADLRLSYGQGDMVWKRADTRENFIRDEYSLLKPELVVSYSPFRYVKIFINSGYRKFYDLTLTNTAPEEFSGLCVGLGLKAGLFK